jgi:copper(I)-binding protein
MKKLMIIMAIGFTLFGLTACGQKELTVDEVWARPGLADGNGAVFFKIDNPTNQEDRLLSAVSDIADAVEIHKTTMVDGNMKMERQDYVPVPAGEQVMFKPGDFHVMLIGLKDDMAIGDSFTITLNFENAGAVVLDVSVQQEP